MLWNTTSQGTEPKFISGNVGSSHGPSHAVFEMLEHRVMMAAQPSSNESSMAYDVLGNLHVAYFDAGSHSLKYARKTAAGIWSNPVTVDSSSADVGHMPSLAVDGAGRVGVAYYDAAKQDLRYAFFDGTTWKTVTVDSKGGTGQNPSLVFDYKNIALISFYKQQTKDLKLATLKNLKKNQWGITTIASKGDVGQFSNLAIDPLTNKPTIAFTDSLGKIQYATKSGGGFTKPVVVDDLAQAGTNLDLAFSANGKPTISYFDPAAGAIKIAQPNDPKAKTFTNEVIAEVPAGSSPNPTLIIDPTTQAPQVVFYDSASNGVFVAKKSTDGTPPDTTQLQAGGGEGFIATQQPGNGSISFGVIDTSGITNGTGPVDVNNTESTPLPPTGVAAAALSPTSIDIGWTDNSDNETGFLIERSIDGTTFSNLVQLAVNTTAYTDATVAEGTTYYYRVSATGAGGEAVAGTIAGASITGSVTANKIVTVTTPPLAPSGLSVATISSSRIELAWTDNSGKETGYRIQRTGSGTGLWQVIDTVGAGTTSYADTTASEGVGYTYRVFATLGAITSDVSNTASTVAKPATPTGLTVTQISPSSLGLSWTNNSTQATQFALERSTNGTTFSALATLEASQTTYTDSSLTEGSVYYYRVKAVGLVDSEYSTSTNATTNPNAPANLSATPLSTSRIDLAWTDNSAAETGYIVQRSVGGGSFVSIATLDPNTTTYSDAGRTEGVSYSYRVQATISGAADSGFSATVATTTLPSAPTSLAATLGSGSQVNLSWTDNATGETGYEVARQVVGADSWTTLATTATNATTYTDTTSAAGTAYSYKVRAVNTAGVSSYASPATVTTIPNPASGLTASSSLSTAITLSWTDSSTGETGFRVERSSDNGVNFTTLATTDAGVTTYADSGLTAASTYVYRVIAVNIGGASAPTNTVTGTSLCDAPTGLALASSTASQINLTWSATTGAESYSIERSTDAGTNWTTIDQVDTLSYSDTVTEATSYQYRIKAVNDGGSSLASSPLTAVSRPAAPAGLSASVQSPTSVALTWTDNSAGETGFAIERSTDGTNFTEVTTTAANATSYTDSTAVESTTYTYRISATGTGGASTTAVSTAVTTRPAAPTSVAASATSATSVSVSWTDNSTGETGFRVERSSDNGETFSALTTTSANTVTYTDSTGLTSSTAYVYRVVAVSAAGETTSANASVTTRPLAPTGVTATVVSETAITVAWTAPTGATGFIVERSADGESYSVVSTITNPATVSFADTGLTEGSGYYYRISATNSGGASEVAGAFETTRPIAPTDLAANASSATQVELSWTNNSVNAGGTFIELSTDGGTTFESIDAVDSSISSYTADVEEGTSPVFRIRAIANGTYSTYSATASADTVPAAPTGVAVASTSDSALHVTWTDHSAHETGFLIERSTDGESYVQVGTASPNEPSFDDSDLNEATTYHYRVRATMGLGRNSTYASPSSATTRPAAPSDLSATLSVSGVDLAWTDNSAGETGFVIERTADAGESWQQIGTPEANAFTDTDVVPGQAYSYRVHATGVGGDSATTEPVEATLIPATPTNVTAETLPQITAIRLNWTDIAGETAYKVYRSENGGGYTLLATLDPDTTTYDDETVSEATPYAYKISSFNLSGESELSSPAATADTSLVAPTNVTATATPASVTLNWTDESSGENGYLIERSEDGGETWDEIGSQVADGTSFTDGGVVEGTEYNYRVIAATGGTRSAGTGTTTITTPLNVPSGLSVASTSASSLTISWTNEAWGQTGFEITRSSDGGTTYGEPVLATALQTSYVDSDLTEGTTYTYQIRAVNAVSASALTSPASATTRPAAPTGLAVTEYSETGVSLSWNDVSDAETGYTIQRSANGGSSWTDAGDVSQGVTTFGDTGLTEGSTYLYRVFATGVGGDSASSATVTAYTHPSAPTTLLATASTPTSVTLNWSNVSANATSNVIERWHTDHWETLNTVAGNVGTYTDNTVQEGHAYEYRVAAIRQWYSEYITANVTTPPSAATGITAAAQSPNDTLVSWTTTSVGATGFRIERSTGGSFSSVGTADAGDTSFTDSTGTEGTDYTYRVVTIGEGGETVSATASATTAPAGPTDLVITSSSPSSITLAWTDNSHAETGFVVQKLDGDEWTTIATTSADATTYTDSTVSSGTLYYYRVMAQQGSDLSMAANGYSESLAVAPSGLTATPASDTTVNLSWTANAGSAGFKVERSNDGISGWTVLTTINDAETTTYADTTVTESTSHVYRVRAINGAGDGPASSTATAVTPPAAPSDLSASAVNANRIDLNWTNHSASPYADVWIYRALGSGSFVLRAQADAETTSFSDTSVQGGQTYRYKVTASHSVTELESASTNISEATTVPSAVTNLTAVSNTATTISLDWDDMTGADRYTVERAPDGTTFSQLNVVFTSDYLDTTVSEGHEYTYRITPISDAGVGASQTEVVTTLPAGPTSVTLVSKTATSIEIAWQDNSSAEAGYRVQRSTDGSTWSTLTTTAANTTSYTDSTATEAATFYYRVTPTSGAGNGLSAVSDPIITLPAAASDLETFPINATRVNLSWVDNSNGETGYRVYRSGDAGSTWSAIGSVLASGTNTYGDTSATPGTSYMYKVWAIGAGGNSFDSNLASALTVPAAVTTLAANPASATQVNLTWTDVGGNASYRLERKPAGGSFTVVTSGISANATSYSDTTAAEGTLYTYKLIAVNTTGDSAVGNQPTATTMPAAPSALSATPTSATTNHLTWTDNSVGETAVEVQRFDGTSWTSLTASLPAGTTSYDDTVAAGSTYGYRVRMSNAGGNSAFSGTANATTIPGEVTNLTATPSGTSTINLHWDLIPGATGYHISRSTDGGSTYPALATVSDGSTTVYADSAVTEATAYIYKVTAFNTTGDGAHALSAASTYAAAPTSLTVDTIADTHLDITWTDNSSGEAHFLVYRSTGGSFTLVDTLAPDTTSWTDSSVSPASNYTYRVTASNGAGESDPTSDVSALTLTSAPVGLSATAASDTVVNLVWTATTGATDGYKLYRDSGGGYTQIATPAAGATSYSDTGRTGATSYSYKLVAVNASGDSALSSATTALTYPAAPTNVTVDSFTETTAEISWTAVSGASSYKILRREVPSGVFAEVGTSSTTTFSDTGLAGGTSYNYKVVAVNATGDSARSELDNVLTLPAAPAGVGTTSVDTTHITVNWVAPGGTITGYKLYRSDGSGFVQIATPAAEDTSYADSGLTSATGYAYKLVAVNTSGDSVDSSISTAFTFVVAPADIAVASVTETAVNLSWTDATDEAGYNVYRSLDSGTTWTLAGSPSADATTFSDTGRTGNTNYTYKIVATNDAGESDSAGVANALTLPAAAASTSAVGTSGTTARFTWGTQPGTVTGFKVSRDNGSGYTLIATVAADQTYFDDTGLTGATTYNYKVVVMNASGDSAASAPVSALTAPAAPAGLSVASVTDTAVNLFWTDVTGETGYTLYRSVDAGANWTSIATPDEDATTYSDTGRTAGTSYAYKLVAANETGPSADSSTLTALTLPAVPTSLAGSTTSTSAIHLTWAAPAGTFTGYSLLRSSGGAYTEVATPGVGATSYDDTGLTEGTTYSYKIAAVNTSGTGSASGVASATTLPAVPTNLVAASITATAVTLTWTDNSSGEAFNWLDRGVGENPSEILTYATLDPDTTTFTDTGLTPGTNYRYYVGAGNNGGLSYDTDYVDALTLTAAPTGLTATSTSASAIHLAWNGVSGTYNNYKLYRDSGSGYAQIATPANGATSYDDTGLNEATSYSYKLVATNDTGDSDFSSVSTVATRPDAPDTLAVASVGETTVNLTFADHSAGESGFDIFRSTNAGETFSLAGTNAANDTTFTDTGMTGGTSYLYRVVATNSGGASIESNDVTALTLPAAPADLAVSVTSDTALHLTWTAESGTFTGYSLLRDSGSGFVEIATPGTGATSYDDTSLTEATSYSYKLVAINGSGNSADSSTVTATTNPTAPSNVSSVALSTTGLNLTWTDNSAGEDGFEIQRSADAGSTWSDIGTAADVSSSGGSGSYSDSGLTEATSYVYRVRATLGSQHSAWSGTYSVDTKPVAPDGLTVGTITDTTVDLSWTDNSAGETDYKVERSADSGNSWTVVGNLSAGVTTFSDTGLTQSSDYVYRVRALRGTSASAYTSTANTTTRPMAPSGLAATPSDQTTINLAWTDNATSEDGFTIERSTDGGDNWSTIDTVADDITSYSDTSAPETATASYRVSAFKGALSSALSSVATATTPVAIPTGVVASATTHEAVHITWSAVSTVATSQRLERSADAGSTWSTVTTLGGSDSSFDDTGLTEDSAYQFRIVALKDAVESTPSTAGTVTTPLAIPTGLSASSPTATSVALTWTNHSSAATNLVIERNAGGGWSTLATIASSLATYTDSTVSEGSAYQYRIHATKSGNASATTSAASVTTLPATPASFSATVISASEIDLAWADNSANETGYRIERSVDGGDFALLTTAAADATSYNDTTTVEGTTYDYRVHAVGVGGDSPNITATATTAPSDPTGLGATVVSAGRVDLAWTDHSAGETGFTVQRSADAGSTWTTLGTVSPNTVSYSDTTAAEATAYTYRVRASRNSANSGWTTTTTTTIPATPTSFTATVPAGTPRVNLAWSDNSSGETGYEVDRSTDGGTSWTTLTTTAANAASYADTTVTEGTTYDYRIRATSTAGPSAYSATATASTLPTTPTALAASAASSTTVNLTWTDNSANETGYKVERSIGGVTWTVLNSIAANSNSYSDTTASEGVTYQYRVRAFTAAVQGSPSASASVSTPLTAPTNITATAVSTTRVNLAWTDNSATESNYKVERSTDGGSTFNIIATAAANSTSYSDLTASAGTTYVYRVRATKSALVSSYATASAVTTVPSNPTNLAASAASDTQVNLTWTDAAGESNYTVERSSDGGSSWSVIVSNIASNTTAYSDTTAAENVTYTYRIKATNTAGASGYSTSGTVTTLPAGPTSLLATTEASDTVTINWTDNSAAESGYRIERRVSGGGWSEITILGANAVTYTDSTLDESVTYEYRVRATVSGRNSAYTNSVLATTLPIAPDSLSVTNTTSSTIDLVWTNTSIAPSLVIERSTDGGDTFEVIDSVSQGATSYTDTGLTADATYVYRVRAYNGDGGFSDYTNAVVAAAVDLG